MKYERFEQLPVWKAAIDLARRLYALTGRQDFGATGACVTRSSGLPFPFPTTLRKGSRDNCAAGLMRCKIPTLLASVT